MVIKAYKATLTEALKIETYTQLIDIALKDKIAKIILRIGVSHVRYIIKGDIKKIRQQIRLKGGR
jgi:hypothetical protein